MVGAMRPVILPALACHIVQLVSNVSENSNMQYLYPDTVPSTYLAIIPINMYDCYAAWYVHKVVA